jgi:hypothetical protein
MEQQGTILKKWLCGALGALVVVAAVFCLINLLIKPSQGVAHPNATLKPDAAAQDRVNKAYGKLPLFFEANQGQADTQAKFLARGPGYSLFLAPHEVVLRLNPSRSQEDRAPKTKSDLLRLPQSQKPEVTTPAELRMKFIRANPQPILMGLQELPGKVHYL